MSVVKHKVVQLGFCIPVSFI